MIEVESEIIAWLASESGYRAYVAVFTLLMMGGIGLPVPEDIPILIGGALAAKNIVNVQAVYITCYIGVLLADQFIFLVGHFFGHRLLQAGARFPLFPTLTLESLDRAREGLRKRQMVYIFMGRHLFPIRSVTFLAAGALHVPFIEFFIADAIAAFVSVSIVLGIGYWLGATLTPEVISHIAHEANVYIVIAVAIGLAIWCIKHFCGKQNKVDNHSNHKLCGDKKIL